MTLGKDALYIKQIENAVQINANTYGAISISNADKNEYGQMNALKLSNLSNADINIQLDGNPDKTFRVPAASEINIEPDDRIVYSGSLLIYNVSAAVNIAAGLLVATISKQPINGSVA